MNNMITEHANIERIRHHIVKELARRKLIQYFTDKKGMTLNDKVYPPSIVDMIKLIPMLHNEVEVVPFTHEVRPKVNTVIVGWNLFVRGINRMFLGTTTHSDAAQLRQAVISGTMPISHEGNPRHTAKEVIDFIIRNGRFPSDEQINPAMPNRQPFSDMDNHTTDSVRMTSAY